MLPRVRQCEGLRAPAHENIYCFVLEDNFSFEELVPLFPYFEEVGSLGGSILFATLCNAIRLAPTTFAIPLVSLQLSLQPHFSCSNYLCNRIGLRSKYICSPIDHAPIIFAVPLVLLSDYLCSPIGLTPPCPKT